jgi:hypothetical protein
MTRTKLYYWSTFSLIFGNALIGLGTGKLFDKTCEGILIGLGLGLLLASITAFKIHKKLLAFNKDNV